MNNRIIDHCFVPQSEEQLLDTCAYPECGKPEIEHEWTVEAKHANPDLEEKMPELRECPFCGGAGHLAPICKGVNLEIDYWSVSCENDTDCVASKAGKTQAKAIAAWNQRADDSIISLHLDALRIISAALGHPYKDDTSKTCMDLAKLATERLRRTEHPWLKAEEVTEQGSYWYWNGDRLSAPYTCGVLYSGTNGKCFVQLKDMPGAPWCRSLRGLFQRIPEPTLPEGKS